MAGIYPESGVPANQALNSVNVPTTGCDSELFHSTNRCQPRFDPAAANALMSEILNAVTGVDCADGTRTIYDCTRLDNLRRAIQQHIENFVFSCCLPQQFPNIGEACQIEQLVMATDSDGCRKIARYSAASSRLGCGNASTVWPDGTSFDFPPDPSDLGSYYNSFSLWDDIQTDTVDNAMLNAGKLTDFTVTVPCDGTVVTLSGTQNLRFNPAGPDGIGTVVIRIDGQFSTNDIVGAVLPAAEGTNYQSSASDFGGTAVTTLSAGVHHIETFWIGRNAGQPAAQARISNIPGAVTHNTCVVLPLG